VGIFGLLLLVGAVGTYEKLYPEEGVQDMELLFMPVLGAIGANVCYTGGWVCELILRTAKGSSGRFGPVAWFAGTSLSAVAMLLPGAMWWCFVAARAAFGIHAP
jgi:hypothetical protein